MADPLTAAELRAIKPRIGVPVFLDRDSVDELSRERDRLFAELERLIDRHLYGDFATKQVVDKDAAIDALLQGGEK